MLFYIQQPCNIGENPHSICNIKHMICMATINNNNIILKKPSSAQTRELLTTMMDLLGHSTALRSNLKSES